MELIPAEKRSAGDGTLFDRLRALRAELAQQHHVPAYLIFSNATLTEMAEKRPRTAGDFMRISGVGSAKASRYGPAFLREIAAYLAEEPEK